MVFILPLLVKVKESFDFITKYIYKKQTTCSFILKCLLFFKMKYGSLIIKKIISLSQTWV